VLVWPTGPHAEEQSEIEVNLKAAADKLSSPPDYSKHEKDRYSFFNLRTLEMDIPGQPGFIVLGFPLSDWRSGWLELFEREPTISLANLAMSLTGIRATPSSIDEALAVVRNLTFAEVGCPKERDLSKGADLGLRFDLEPFYWSSYVLLQMSSGFAPDALQDSVFEMEKQRELQAGVETCKFRE